MLVPRLPAGIRVSCGDWMGADGVLPWGRAAFALIVSLLAVLPAGAAERFALVIGNQGYTDKVGPLRNPHNDAALVGKALADVGFNLLPSRKDAKRNEMLYSVYELAAKARSAGRNAVTFLYYAGHGIAVGGENVLIPTDADNTTDATLGIMGVRLGEIVDILKREAPDAVHFVVLDACRTIRGRRGDRGFAPVNDRRTGVVIAFSTAPGEVATDEGATSAPYAMALAEEIVKPGRSDQVVFNAVRTRVVAAANGQTPWIHDGLIGERVVFKSAPIQPPPVTVLPPPAQPQLSEAERAWQLVKDSPSTAALEAFIRRYGDTFQGDLAKLRLAELKQVEASRLATEAAKQDAEKQRLALLQQEEDRKRAQAEAKKRADDAELTRPGRVFRDCPDCPEMVVVRAGSFTMGSPANEQGRNSNEGPQHKVSIARPFAVGKYEVTFAEWDACVSAGGCAHQPGDSGWGRRKRPVINVSWNDITEQYLPWLSRTTGKTYRLLTEAEWEYAARAGTTTPFSTGPTITPGQGNFSGKGTYGGSGEGVYRGKTVDVGSFQPNAFGLYDMHGNVYEWIQDCWNGSYQGAPTDGSAWMSGNCSQRILRDGSWADIPTAVRSAFRTMYQPDARYDIIGFRVARTL